jgi:hypothetical protein
VSRRRIGISMSDTVSPIRRSVVDGAFGLICGQIGVRGWLYIHIFSDGISGE